MAIEIVMPKLGLTMITGTVARWLKNEGEYVAKGEELFEVETEKLVNTIESPANGVLLKIVASEGDELPIAAVIGYLGEAGEIISFGGNDSILTEKAASLASYTSLQVVKAESGNIERIKISPLAAKLAKELNIDRWLIKGTGPGGRITKVDVENHSAAIQAANSEKTDYPAAAAALPRYDTAPYSGMRKAIGDNMTRSWHMAPTVTEHVNVDVSKVLEIKKMLNDNLQEGEQKITVTVLLIKIVAKALELKPGINVSLDGHNIKYYKDVNIGVAVSLDIGLIVPVIKNVNKKSIYQVSNEVKELVKKARSGRLNKDDVTGGTFTISNLGSYGSVDYFTPIINQPESAILGIGRTVETPAVVDGNIVIRPMMGFSLSFDHRVIDGGPAAEFLAEIIRLTLNPLRGIL